MHAGIDSNDLGLILDSDSDDFEFILDLCQLVADTRFLKLCSRVSESCKKRGSESLIFQKNVRKINFVLCVVPGSNFTTKIFDFAPKWLPQLNIELDFLGRPGVPPNLIVFVRLSTSLSK